MAKVKKSQLKALIKEIIREVKSALISESYLSRSDLDLGTMKAVNVEEDAQSAGPWTPTGGNLYKISPELATELLGGKPAARPGYEALVPAPKGFKTDKGFVWLSQKVISGQMSWVIRNSGNWVMKGGKITVVGEQSVSGGAGAYSTPFAFKKKTNEVIWDKPDDKIYTNLAAWEIDNIDVNGIYTGEPLSNYGFPYKVGQKVESGPSYRLLAMKKWNDAKKKKNQNLTLGKPAGINEDLGFGAGLAIGAAGILVLDTLLKIVVYILKTVGANQLLDVNDLDSMFDYVEKHAKNSDPAVISKTRDILKKEVERGTIRTYNDLKDYLNKNLRLKEPEERELDEMTATGAVAGYQTPYAFSKNKSGSKRALDVTTKMGYKKVGESPRV